MKKKKLRVFSFNSKLRYLSIIVGVLLWIGTLPAYAAAPTVANPIPNQSATEDQAFNFQFAANTFADIDVGNILTYTAQLAGGGGLPAWLSFDSVTRTFSGTPLNSHVGTVSIDVIANDGNGGSVTDTFIITVIAVTPLLPEDSRGTGGCGSGSSATTQPQPTTIIVNGEPQSAGTETTSTVNGQITVVVIVSSETICRKIDEIILKQMEQGGTTGAQANIMEILVAAQKCR